METDLKSLEEAVLLFYQSDARHKEGTHEFLMQVQTSPMAWQFSWQLMLPDKVGCTRIGPKASPNTPVIAGL